jgi:23S rRNA pseudouridine2605 synthase
VASRRGAEDLLRAGRVRVNGELAGIGASADPERDRIAVDGRILEIEPREYWILHKPRGVITTRRDPQGRATVVDLVPESERRLFPVGRLDRDTEGLVLLTNDGPLAHALLHPSHGVEREYRVTVKGRVSAATLRQLARGVELKGGIVTAPARVGRAHWSARSGSSRFSLVLIEGRKRQIRRACAALGHPVVRLLRVRIGPLHLATLAPGATRRVEARERRALEALRDAAGSQKPDSTASGNSRRKPRPVRH